MRRVETTPGRMLLSEILPRHPAVGFELINQLLGKKQISDLIDYVYRFCGQKETVIFCDRLMALGFQQACKAGISFGKDDLIIPEAKHRLVAEVQEKVKEYEQQYQDGLITQREKYNKEVDAWTACCDKVAEEMMKVIREVKPGEPINSVWMMSDSGARGSAAQIKQLAGMRGLMTKPSGEIIATPIISNFKEGLTVLEYFNSTHGARKGLADTALKTANSGLSDPPPRRCRAGRDHHRGGLRHDPRSVDPRGRRGRQHHRAAGRPHPRPLRRGRCARPAVGRGRARRPAG